MLEKRKAEQNHMNLFQHQERIAKEEHTDPVEFPDPVLAVIFAIAGVSLGQFYNGHSLRGLVWVAGGIAVFLLILENLLIAPVGIFFLAGCAIDAYFKSLEIRSRKIRFMGTSCLFWVEVMLFIALGMALGITTVMHILSVNGTIL
jgi:hypothetical protein